MNYVMKRFLNEISGPDPVFKFPIRHIQCDGQRYPIKLQQITTPEDFWITFVDFPHRDYYGLVHELRRVYSTNIEEKKIQHLNCVDIGDHLIFQSGVNFSRGMVHAIHGRNNVDVMDLDVGEIFESRTREMLFPILNNALIRQTPIMSYHCKLDGIAPASQAGWTSEIADQFTDHYSKCTISCAFVKFEDDVCTVSLSMKSGREVADHMTSIGLARRPRHALAPQSNYPDSKVKYTAGENVDVIVCHVESSAKFYVQLATNEDIISKMSREMQFDYSRNADSYQTAPTIRDQICAAKYHYDSRWYRAIIMGRPSPTRVEIQFVDYGNTSRIVNSDVKILKSEYAKFARQAFECKLHKVEDNQFQIAKLAELISNKRMSITIDGVDEINNQYIVTLYSYYNKKRYCVNDFMRGRGKAAPSIPSVNDYSALSNAVDSDDQEETRGRSRHLSSRE